MERFITGTDQAVYVHDRAACAGNHCPVHNPSPHHMKSWKLHWRDDSAIFERLCPHGIGHPDPDSIAYIRRVDSELGDGDKAAAMAVHPRHGCDGCCVKLTASCQEADRDILMADGTRKKVEDIQIGDMLAGVGCPSRVAAFTSSGQAVASPHWVTPKGWRHASRGIK